MASAVKIHHVLGYELVSYLYYNYPLVGGLLGRSVVEDLWPNTQNL